MNFICSYFPWKISFFNIFHESNSVYNSPHGKGKVSGSISLQAGQGEWVKLKKSTVTLIYIFSPYKKKGKSKGIKSHFWYQRGYQKKNDLWGTLLTSRLVTASKFSHEYPKVQQIAYTPYTIYQQFLSLKSKIWLIHLSYN